MRFKVLLSILALAESISFERNGYRDVVVSVSPDLLPSESSGSMVENLKVVVSLKKSK